MDEQSLYETVEADREALVDLARHIWEHPELAFEETEAAGVLGDWAEERGLDVVRGVGPLDTALIAEYGEGEPHIGIVGEYDALPGMSQRTVAEPSPVEEGAPGHGCGHNLFGTAALGATVAVADAIEAGDLDGTVRFYGTPAEEGGAGKLFMEREGVFDDLDAVITWHPGHVNTPIRSSTLAVDSVEFSFEGVSAHAAGSPESGRSALDAVSLLNTGVEYMREHVPDEARIHYAITDGGGAPNVVPAEASVYYYVRAPTRPEVERITDWLYDIAEGAATMTRTDVRAQYVNGLYDYLSNEPLADLLYENLRALGPIEYDAEDRAFAADLKATFDEETLATKLQEFPKDHREAAADSALYTEPVDAQDPDDFVSVSSDLGNVSWTVPTGYVMCATWPVGTPAHTWQAVAADGDFALQAVPYVAKLLARSAADLLADDELVAEVRAEFEAATADRSYEDPLPEGAEPVHPH